jgi:hypothetical protein
MIGSPSGLASIYGKIRSIPFSAAKNEQGIFWDVSGNFQIVNREFEGLTGGLNFPRNLAEPGRE